jgi:hypothetical protein
MLKLIMQVLFFSPFAAIWKHARPELSVANDLEKLGHSVHFLRCNYLFQDFCISMSAFGLTTESSTEKKLQVCKRCIRTSNFSSNYLGFPTKYLNDFGLILPSDTQLANQATSENWESIHFEGVPVGAYAAYEFLLNHKITDARIPENLFEEYRLALIYTIYTARVARVFLQESNYDRVVVYNRFYSLNRAFCHVAEGLGIPTFTLQASGPSKDVYSRYNLEREDLALLKSAESNEWARTSSLTLSERSIEFGFSHLEGLLDAKSFWVYSNKSKGLSELEFRGKIGALPSQKIVLLAASSNDELNALIRTGVKEVQEIENQPKVFSTQLEWIAWVINQIRNKPNLYLVIRLHPREFANRREGVNSEYGEEMVKSINAIKPSNCHLNLPSDSLSIYNFIPFTDLLLTGYSSVALDFRSFGITVLSHETQALSGYPSELVIRASSQEDYLSKFQFLTEEEKVMLNGKVVFRWYNFRFNQASRSFSKFSLFYLFRIVSFWLRAHLKFGFPISRALIQLLRIISKGSANSPFNLVLERGFGGLSQIPVGQSELLSEEEEDMLIQTGLRKIRAKLSR